MEGPRSLFLFRDNEQRRVAAESSQSGPLFTSEPGCRLVRVATRAHLNTNSRPGEP